MLFPAGDKDTKDPTFDDAFHGVGVDQPSARNMPAEGTLKDTLLPAGDEDTEF